jgi:hydrogenase maturation protein HypF
MCGVVQGVGFRPHVARTAATFAVTGWCGNDDESVFIEVQGTPAEVDAFADSVAADAPPLAHIVSVEWTELPPAAGEASFRIVPSERASGLPTLIPPDVAPCADCLAEMADPADRRYLYPFITCTNCGPRLSIIRDVPYDRPLTTLAAFPMCDACRAEYTDPTNRRYHAQPISCFDCGPRLWLQSPADAASASHLHPASRAAGLPATHGGEVLGEWGDAIVRGRGILAGGGILAVKGIGGFTVMANARDHAAVDRLRRRKHRPHKPFAVMAPDVATTRSFADLSPTQERVLTSPQRPIVLAPMAAGYDLAAGVAPGLGDVGVMLPSAPLHTLLVAPGEVVIATSANISGEPLIYRNRDAARDLAPIVDAVLTHDRPIHVPVEDSVLMADGEGATPIRRSRGYAPLPVRLGDGGGRVLAVGGELKNTFAMTRGGMAFLSAHIGDMGSLACQRAFERSVAQMSAMHREDVALVAADLHPGYATTAWAERYTEAHDLPLLQVQHHHAHALSLLAEHRAVGRRAAIAVFDGTGYGLDGNVWGGEILTFAADPMDWQRAWHLPPFALPGGDSAVQNPWKVAHAVLAAFTAHDDVPSLRAAASPAEVALVRSQLASGVGVVATTSAGRLFDAVAALLGVRHHVTYEAQAAMELERLARACSHEACAHVRFADVRELVGAIVDAIGGGARPSHGGSSASGRRPDAAARADGVAPACLARQFHAGLAGIAVDALVASARTSGAEVAGLTGGVFQNRLFTADCLARLADVGLPVLVHRVVPANDGGLALGQALAGWLHLAANRPGGGG